MTYCVGLQLDGGLILASDTRTNAGVDNIASFKKMHVWEKSGDRVLVLLSAGNLATTQAIVATVTEAVNNPDDPDLPNIMNAATMFQAAKIFGGVVREAHEQAAAGQNASNIEFSGSFIFAGQINGAEMKLFQLYPEGNFIEATKDTPFFQIGEHKYGKPILDRVPFPGLRLGQGAKLALLSFDSTIRSNLSVGMPIDLMIYEKDSLCVNRQIRIEQDDVYFQKLSRGWSDAMAAAFQNLDEFPL